KEKTGNDISPNSALSVAGLKKALLSQAQKLPRNHLQANHDICIFGDYDADGVTATSIMWQAVSAYAKTQKSTSRILPFIPDRHRHGYGLSDKAVADVVSGEAFRTTQFPDLAPKLIVTVDTGIVAHVGIKSFRDQGIDVIVTDHHQPEDKLPPASHIVHTLSTSGAGLAWIFAMYLLGDPARKLLDLATIGVVGDMMPLQGLNRSILSAGLSALTHTQRPGLIAMKEAMGVNTKDLTTYDISFGIAPRINASGRIYNPLDALRLLCTSDPSLAHQLAAKIESHNKDRQEYTDRSLKLALSQPHDHNIIIVVGDYHEGVIGLVAGKIVELYHRPAIVLSSGGEVVKGSARSLPGINITQVLRSLNTPFLGLGGHDQAAGFSIAKSVVPQFTQELERYADQEISHDLLVKRETADLELSLTSTTLALAKKLSALEPYGLGNPKPKFLLKNLTVLEDRALGKDGKHHKLTVEQNATTREVLMFNTQHSHPLHFIKVLICNLDINVWRDKESLQLISSYVET
ncbi:MAG: Single-stranded-DNA-specific exonuclease RecJ, partial [Microgenomates group bacterium GW2011_GWA2_46_7]